YHNITLPLTLFFLFTAPAPTEIYTLSLHDALPICAGEGVPHPDARHPGLLDPARLHAAARRRHRDDVLHERGDPLPAGGERLLRSEEHTSELQSRSDLVCRLLLEKKKNYS